MKPMQPMEPLEGGGRWWPEELGAPASSGAQDGVRYAVFPDSRRLVIERDGRTESFDTGEHLLNGVQQSGPGGEVVFGGKDGPVPLHTLHRVG